MDKIKIGGNILIIDIEEMSKFTLIEPENSDRCKSESTKVESYDKDGNLIGSTVTTSKYHEEKQLDSSKYEMVRGMLDILFSYDAEIDDSLGFTRGIGKLPINIKIAINTLIEYNILKEVD